MTDFVFWPPVLCPYFLSRKFSYLIVYRPVCLSIHLSMYVHICVSTSICWPAIYVDRFAPIRPSSMSFPPHFPDFFKLFSIPLQWVFDRTRRPPSHSPQLSSTFSRSFSRTKGSTIFGWMAKLPSANGMPGSTFATALFRRIEAIWYHLSESRGLLCTFYHYCLVKLRLTIPASCRPTVKYKQNVAIS